MRGETPMKPIGYDRKRTAEILDAQDIDVLVASTDVNVFYTTGLPTLHVANNPILWVLKNQFPYIALVRRDGEVSLFYWMVFSSLDKFSWVKDATGIISPQQAMKMVSDKLTDWGVESGKTVGLESLMPRYQADYLASKFPGVKVIDGDSAFLKMRLIKSKEEQERIKRSTTIAEKAIEQIIEEVREGMTDHHLLKIARRTIVEEGAEGWDHLTIGIGSADPEAPGVGTVMRRGDITRLDIGAVWKGYVSDVSRHVVIGEIPEGADEVVKRMIKVQEFCVDQIRPGVDPNEVYKATMKFHQPLKPGVKPIITCHSIGLECEEAQIFSRMGKADFLFEEGMVMDVEIWQNFKDLGLIGVEDCYRVTQKGCERISSLDKEIFVKRG
jgi:Xaa-Pro aminopeptidase